VRVFEEDQGIGDQTPPACVRQPPLERPGFLIGNPPQPVNVHDQPAAARAGTWLAA
jgi:hypothetical protein